MPRSANSALMKEKGLIPQRAIVFVSEGGCEELPPEKVSIHKVGFKAYGLTCLPEQWTFPFFCVSACLYTQYLKAKSRAKKNALISKWAPILREAARAAGIDENAEILARSSGNAESIMKRGRFYTVAGGGRHIDAVVADCLARLAADGELRRDQIPLLVQRQSQVIKAKGHLSNERRCYEESRDWIGEIESADAAHAGSFQINLRHWREKLPDSAPQPLFCALSPQISEVLKVPADWAFRKKVRVHFEWVWDGSVVYLVQADEEAQWEGHNPVEEHAERSYHAISFEPQVLRRVTDKDAKRYSKIGNVFTYLKLNLPIAPLFILDDKAVIERVANGNVSVGLVHDINELVKGSLVIRTDLAHAELKDKQLLPRTEELHDATSALEWLIKNSKVAAAARYGAAFIFHNFIPALSAAFAYAAPNEPIVQIEALWGLPEGLYYNAHDKYVVDTLKSNVDLIRPQDISNFLVRDKRAYKKFFVSTTASGKWETLPVKPPFDWRGTLSEADCKTIAFESRRIAALEGRSVSIMWFVGLPFAFAGTSAIPWYHEEFDISMGRPSITTRTKTVFEKCFTIRYARDVADLAGGDELGTSIKRIRVQPSEESLLRDKGLLRKIGELAKARGAIIVLEGAVLSHAYYQLLETGAVVEIVHPFIGFDERHEFNKLVRDKIPEIIRQRGENVTTAKLESEALIKALREKLIEEAFELLDAKDMGSIVAELADIKEVIDALIKHLRVEGDAVRNVQRQKRADRGGFEDGIILVETEKIPPTSRSIVESQPVFEDLFSVTDGARMVDESEVRRRAENLERRTDKRLSAGKLQLKATIVVPVTRNSWSTATMSESIRFDSNKIVFGSVSGVRKGGAWSVEVTVNIDDSQLELL